MKLLKLHLLNFMCYKQSIIDFPHNKIVNIYGKDVDRNTSNGIGKSAIKEAILFALYGKTKVNLIDLVRKGTSGCKVVLTFEVDNKKIDIIRSYKKHSSLTIKINGNEVDFNKIKQKKNYIENLLGMNYEDCINFSIFDAVRFEDLSSLSSSEIKRLLQLLFNYEKLNKTYDFLKDTLRNNDILLKQLQNRNIHYYSTYRENVLKKGYSNILKEIQTINNKNQFLSNFKFEIGQKIAQQETIKSRNQKKIRWLMNKDNCPTCNSPLTHKIQILNEYQSEINKCDKIIGYLKKKLFKVEEGLLNNSNKIVYLSNKQLKRNNLINKLLVSKQNVGDIKKIEKEYNKYKLASDIMKKFESYVMEHYMIYLEQIINEYLIKLTDIQCKLSFLKQGSLITRSIDKFYMKLYRLGEEYSYMSLSSGERMLVAYAFKLAINTLNFKDTFLFIDEGFNRLDVTNRQKLVQMLQNSPFTQIFLISHDDSFDKLPTIYIKKKNEESTVIT